MYYGTYKIEVKGGVGFHDLGSSLNAFFDAINFVECEFVIDNPCFENDVVSFDTSSLI